MNIYKTKLMSLALLGACGLGFSSCGDYLNIEPKNFISEDNFWNEKTDIDQMVTGLYTSMQSSDFIGRCVMWGETRSDNIGGGLNYDSNTNVYRTLKENLLSDNGYTDWTSFYSVINKCNTIIARTDQVHNADATYTQSNVNATIAECSFIRDLCYFYLVRAFKDVPYYTEAIQSDDDIPALPAHSGDSIVRCLITDLESVADNALVAYPEDSNKKFNSNRNRVTRSAIYALLADLCLWNNDYQKCVNYCQKVIDRKVTEYKEDYSSQVTTSGDNPAYFQYSTSNYTGDQYPLYPCYSGNTFGADFDAIFGDGNSFESIFELNFSYDGSDGNYISNSALSSLYGQFTTSDANGYGVLGVVENVLTDLTQKSYKVYDHQYDCRFYTDIHTDKEYTKGYVGKLKFNSNSVQLASGSSNTLPYTSTPGHDINANRNWIFYRLTDVMLMQAEALVEMAGDNLENKVKDETGAEVTQYDENLEKAFSLVWCVNRRSIMTNSTSGTSQYALSISNYKTKSLMRELVMKERRRELMFEGKRWFDIIRRCHRDGSTKYAQNNVPAKISSGGSSTLFVNYESLYWPYNKSEVKNNPDLKQKAYYGDDDDQDGNFTSTK